VTSTDAAAAPATTADAPPWPHRLAVALLAGGSIAALLADIFAVAPMAAVFWFVSVPSMAVLVALAALPGVHPDLRRRIRVGAFAGVVGTLGYDIVRIPFALAGQRVFAPIESYGMLIADATASSGWTSTLGWLYHLSNGITFGVAYAAVAARRHWAWGVAWGLLLESVAVFSPFAVRYGIQGQAVPIAIAYGAHLFYGYPLGRLVQHLDRTDAGLRRLGRLSVPAVIGVAVVLVLGWHRPWLSGPAEDEAARLSSAGTPTTVVSDDRFEPEWLRIRAGGCAAIENRTPARFVTPFGVVEPDGRSTLCFSEPGVYRVRLGPRPYSGGFVYVDRRGTS
jgi:hypothetical protein